VLEVEDIVKLSSSEESEDVWFREGSEVLEGAGLKVGTMGDRGARFFWRLLARGARIRAGCEYMRC